MARKTVTKHTVHDRHNKVETFIPIGVLEGDEPGPTLAVVSGVHATEYAAHDGAAKFWAWVKPEDVRGRIFVVLCADVTAQAAHTMYTNPVDGKNLNRVWPGKEDGTLTEVIAHAITQRVVRHADALVDCHGGEYDEDIDLFTITHSAGNPDVDKRARDLAVACGLPFAEVIDIRGGPIGAGTGAGEAIRAGVPAITLECGGRGLKIKRHVLGTFSAIVNAARHVGCLPGEVKPWSGKPVVIDHGIMLRTKEAGIYAPVVTAGAWIEEGALFSRVYDFDGTLLEEIRAPEAGVVLDVIVGRTIKANAFCGKIGVL
jgi:predicted deacylase